MAQSANLQLTLDVAEARSVLDTILVEHGYDVSWGDPHRGLAVKGDEGTAMLLGPFAMHYKYHLRVVPALDGTVTASLIPGNSGLAGGLPGMWRVRREFRRLITALRAVYESRGVLRGVDMG